MEREWKKIIRIEPIVKEQVFALGRALGRINSIICRLKDVDITKGRGLLNENNQEHCLWTYDKRRIEIEITPDGGILASCSNLIDPNCPE